MAWMRSEFDSPWVHNMTNTQSVAWGDFYDKTKNLPPSPLLLKALENVVTKNKAIDIGGGALKDTKYLLSIGFDVTVVDSSEFMNEEATQIVSTKLHTHVSTFFEFDFPKDTFDLASAMFSLPFNPSDTFQQVFERIKHSLIPSGIFVGNFFGTKDDWSSNPKMTFHTKADIETLFADMETILLEEREYNGHLTDGMPKHWHVFNVIAKKSP